MAKDTKTTKSSKWIEWKGGECPVPATSPVSYQIRSGSRHSAREASMLDWVALNLSSDIVAYRPHEAS